MLREPFRDTSDLNWSDETRLNMADEVGIPKEFHASAFNYTSGFVHPSMAFMIGYLSIGSGQTIEISTKPQDDEANFALKLSHSLILNAIDLRLKYAPSEMLRQQLEERDKDFTKIWGYPPPI